MRRFVKTGRATDAGNPIDLRSNPSVALVSLCLGVSILIVTCAKKLPPPNTDRFAPTLQSATVVNQTRIDLIFDEAMRRGSIKAGDFAIVDPRGETLGLRAVTALSDPAGISLVTYRQSRERYTLYGTAADTAGNRTQFAFRFTGSTRPDTVPPAFTSIQPHLNSTRVRKNITVSFGFSKAIDTATYGGYRVVPAGLTPRFAQSWDPTFTKLSFQFADSLGPDTVVSFIVFPTLRDYTGNHPVQPGFTSFVSDSLLPPKFVRGRVSARDSLPKNAFVFLEVVEGETMPAESGAAPRVAPRTEPVLATVVRGDGSFGLHAKDARYSALAVADTNYDGYVDLVGRTPNAALPETLIVHMEPETLKVRIDSLF